MVLQDSSLNILAFRYLQRAFPFRSHLMRFLQMTVRI